MARIAGINVPPHKHAEIGLTSMYGIGRPTAQKICTNCGVPFDRMHNLAFLGLAQWRFRIVVPQHAAEPPHHRNT